MSRIFNKKKQRKNSKVRKSRQWILAVTAAGVVFGFTIGNSRAMNIGYVKNEELTVSRTFTSDKNASPKQFSIPAGTLGELLATFEKATGWRIKIPAEIRDIASAGVSGNYTEEQALKQILQNTGVVFTVTAPKEVALKLQGPAETVEVHDENSTLSSPKYTAPLRDIPQTITIIDNKTIQEQGATTLRDVLRNVPGLTVAAGEGGNVGGDNITVRGFSARNDIYVDGARDLSPQSRDPFNLEQVEVVKGSSSATSGRGSTGGTINLVSKTPGFKPTYNFDLGLGSDKTKRVTGDINLPLERLRFLGDKAAFRLNFLAHDSNVAGRDIIENNRWGVAPTLTFGIGTKSTLTLGYFHLSQDNITDYGIPWVPNTNNVLVAFRDKPAPVSRDTFYGFKERDDEVLKSNLATVTLNHVFNDKMVLRNQFRYGRSTRDSIATPPRFGNVNSTVITREMRAWQTIDETYDNQTDLTARFKTFGIEHALVTGVEFVREKNLRYTRAALNASTTLLNPNPFDAYTGTIFRNPLAGDVVATTQSAYILDTLKLHQKFEVNGSFRYDRYNGEGFLPPTLTVAANGIPTFGLTRAAIAKLDNLFNYRLAAVYKPFEIGSVYVSYGTAVNPSLSGLGYENATVTTLDPEKTNTLEAGTKWDLFDSRILLSGAIFRVEKTNARTPDLNGLNQILDAKQRVNGLELSVTGNINKDWSILTGYTLLDSKIIESNALPTLVYGVPVSEIGKHFINTPRNSFNLWSTYQLPFRLNVGGGARYVDRRFANTINTRFVEDYWLVEATASYQLTKNIDIRVNGYNLANKFYFDRITGGQVVPGPGRSILVTTGFRF